MGLGGRAPDNAQLYLYGAGGTKKITDDGNTHFNYGLADNGWIIWLQNTGQMAGDLYAYRNGSSCRLDTGVGYEGNFINSRGQVVWDTRSDLFSQPGNRYSRHQQPAADELACFAGSALTPAGRVLN